MDRRNGIVRNGLRRTAWLAIAVLVMCLTVFGSRWYSLHKDYKAQNQEWFETQERKFLAFAKLGIRQYEATPDLPGLPGLVDYMQSVFDPDRSNAVLNLATVTDGNSGVSELPYKGRAMMCIDLSGDQICAYGDSAVLGLRDPIYIRTTDEALKFAFPYMQTLADGDLSCCCIDPDQTRYASFADVVKDLLQSDKVWAEKDGYTFKKCNVTFDNDLNSDIVITRKDPGILSSYGKNLAKCALWIFGAGAAAVVLTWIVMWLLEKHARKTKDEENPEETWESVSNAHAESLLAIVKDAESSLGPKPEFDRICDAIDQVKTSKPVVEKPEKKPSSELSESGKAFLRKHTTLIGVLALVVAAAAVLMTTILVQNSICNARLDARILQDFEMDRSDLDDSFSTVYYNEVTADILMMDVHLDSYLPEIGRQSDSSETDMYSSSSYFSTSAVSVESRPFSIWIIQRSFMFDSDHVVVVQDKSSSDEDEIFMGSHGGEDRYYQYTYSIDRPKVKAGDDIKILPAYCDEYGNYYIFYEGKIIVHSDRMIASRDIRDGVVSSIDFSPSMNKLFAKPDEYGDLSLVERVAWINSCTNIMDSDTDSGWLETYRFLVQRFEIEELNNTNYQYILFEDGSKELKTLREGVLTDVILGITLLIVAEAVWILIRIKARVTDKTPEQAAEEPEKKEDAEKTVSRWAPVLKAVEDAETALGSNGYLEDLRKRIREIS